MKKVLFISVLSILFYSCTGKSSQERAKESLDKINLEIMKKELYIDSLVRVAYGNGDYKYMKQNRLNAIDLLEKEVPEIKQTLDSLRNTIYQGNF